jgi:anti-sigma factor RsiW
MNCEEVRSFLGAFTDRELDLARSLEIERHLRECAACPGEYDRLRALSSAVKNGATYFELPTALEQRIRTALRQAAPSADRPATRSRPRQPMWRPIAIAASAAFVMLASWNLAGRFSRSPDDLVARDLIASHVRSLMANHLTDVASSDQHTVKPWFDGKVDFSPPVEDLAAHGFALIGGRLDYVQNRPVAALVYQRRKHFINLYIWPSGRQSEVAERTMSIQGYNLIHWSKSGLDYWAVSNLASGELEDFVRRARSEG